MPDQPRLFDDDPQAPDPSAPAAPGNDACRQQLEAQHAESRALAARLPAAVHFGTSSWSFPGWAGLVYS